MKGQNRLSAELLPDVLLPGVIGLDKETGLPREDLSYMRPTPSIVRVVTPRSFAQVSDSS